jgi:hypothetical protein
MLSLNVSKEQSMFLVLAMKNNQFKIEMLSLNVFKEQNMFLVLASTSS